MLSILTFLLLPLLGTLNSKNFPDVLSADEEKFFLEKWKNKDLEARNTLIEHNLRLVAHIVKKFDNYKNEKDDLISVGTYGLIKAINTYNFDTNTKLSTYASRCIENEILMYIRNNKKHKDVVSLFSTIGEDKEGNEIKLCDVLEDKSPSIFTTLLADEEIKKLNIALKKLDKREIDIISRRFGFNNYKVETQKEIAKSMGISRSYVSRIEKRALTKLYLYLK